MASLKRVYDVESTASSLSNKVYVRSTRSGKVQKIVREVYLRTDIPCSSQLCRACLENAPQNASRQGECVERLCLNQVLLFSELC
jgi:exosome complex exonuclease DIS3/RRP44